MFRLVRSNQHILDVLLDRGRHPARVRFVEIPFDQMPAALDGGRGDAAWMAEPAQTIAEAQGARVVASPFEETDPKPTVATYFTSTRLAQQNPGLVKGSPRR